MAEPPILPLVDAFVGERYLAAELLSARLAPPYDVIDDDARRQLVERDPHNIVHLILPDGNADRYARAAKTLAAWRAKGVLARDRDPGVYVIQQEFTLPDGSTRLRTGVIGALAVEPYEAGRVRPHEQTHAEPKADRLALVRATRATFEAIFLLARDARGHLRRRLEGVTRHEPLAVAELDDVGIGLWRVGGVQAREIARAASEGVLYIADGHHRYETAVAYRSEYAAAARIPALIVPVEDPGLVALATHRIIRGSAVDPEAFLARWRDRFSVEDLAPDDDVGGRLARLARTHIGCVVAFPGGRLVACSMDRAAPDGEPDIAVIEREIVQPLAGADGNVSYNAALADARAAVHAQGVRAAVLVPPTPLEQVLAVADRAGVMPPKSTYFIPKVPSGLVGMTYED